MLLIITIETNKCLFIFIIIINRFILQWFTLKISTNWAIPLCNMTCNMYMYMYMFGVFVYCIQYKCGRDLIIMLYVHKINLSLKPELFDENVTSEKPFWLDKFVNLNDTALTKSVNATDLSFNLLAAS